MTNNTISFLVSLAVTFTTVGIAFGIIQSKVCTLEEVAKSYKMDHDLVIQLTTKMDVILQDISEIKVDLKEIKNKIR